VRCSVHDNVFRAHHIVMGITNSMQERTGPRTRRFKEGRIFVGDRNRLSFLAVSFVPSDSFHNGALT
jgi:hypothetical protein